MERNSASNFLRTSESRAQRAKLVCLRPDFGSDEAARYAWRLIHSSLSPQGVNKAAPLDAQFEIVLVFNCLCIAEQGNFAKLHASPECCAAIYCSALLSVLFELHRSRAAYNSVALYIARELFAFARSLARLPNNVPNTRRG